MNQMNFIGQTIDSFPHHHEYIISGLYFAGRIPFSFLEDIHARFVKTYGRACHTAPAYGMNEEFSRILSQQMDYYSNDPNADRMNRIRGEMNQVINYLVFVLLEKLLKSIVLAEEKQNIQS